MTDELIARVSELRAAADRLRSSSSAVRAALESAQAEAAGLTALGAALPSAAALLSAGPSAAADQLDTLRDQLDRAVTGLEDAARPLMIPLGILWDRLDRRPALRRDPAPIPAAAYTLGSYLSRYNRPLYDRFLADQATITTETARIVELRAERERTQGDLMALNNRLATAGIAAAGSPQVAALQGQIDHLARKESAALGRIEAAQASAEDARQRLLRVTPPDGADTTLIQSLEGTDSAPYVLANTRDCVNYIASRVAIPGELAANAHLWDERAAELTRFGIGIGDEPLPGAVLVMETDHPFASDQYGHVMLVESVGADGAVWVTDNNNPTPVRLSDLTSETSGERIKYLYLPWYTRAG